tara:strand:- start:147 stop:533 length:387 start_codon:yes stop_codon:yes gene_type:complete
MSIFGVNPNNSKKQLASKLPDNAYDRAYNTPPLSASKTPNYVIVANGDGSNDSLGFFFGSQADFTNAATSEGAVSLAGNKLTASSNYVTFGDGIAAGTRLDIHPLAWSGSAAMKVVFVYKSGLSTGGR